MTGRPALKEVVVTQPLRPAWRFKNTPLSCIIRDTHHGMPQLLVQGTAAPRQKAETQTLGPTAIAALRRMRHVRSLPPVVLPSEAAWLAVQKALNPARTPFVVTAFMRSA